MSKRYIGSFRDRIDEVAIRLGMLDEIKALSDLYAIRRIQTREGNTPCFGAETAIYPANDGTCQNVSCLWKGMCELYRSQARPLDVELSTPDREQVVNFISKVLAERKCDHKTEDNQLSVTVKSLANARPLTRKLVIGSSKSVLSERADGSVPLRPIILLQKDPYYHWPVSGGTNPTYFIEREVLYTSDVNSMFNWFNESEPFVRDGVLGFRPFIVSQEVTEDVWRLDVGKTHPVSKTPPPSFSGLNTPHLAIPNGDIHISDPNIVPLLNFEIPMIENISIQDLHRIMVDNPEELCAFRNFLFTKVDKMRSRSLESESFFWEVALINHEIKDHIKKFESDTKRANIKHYTDLTGGSLAAFTLLLYCIISGEANVLTFLGHGGIVYKLSQSYSEYLISMLGLKNNPVHFLWLIGKSQRT